MNLTAENIDEDPAENGTVEIVEKKGKGHPDTICDSIAQKISQELCREYQKKFNKILHHNTDEVQLVAGNTAPEFGGGEIIEKIYILLAGRATKKHNGQKIEVDKIAENAAYAYIAEELKNLSAENVRIESRIGETSTDLKTVYNEENLSNDTSFGVGHYPLSRAEKLATNLEKQVRNIEESGEDVKIMVHRNNDAVDVTVAAAGLANKINSLKQYKEFIRKTRATVREEGLKHFREVEAAVNSADDIENGDVYLTVTGTSAENGDDGSVGRGNRYNGLITPMRSMSLEAHSGKNPVNHVGRLNQERAHKVAKTIYEETGEFSKVYLLNKIGQPIKDPVTYVETTGQNQDLGKMTKQAIQEISKNRR